MTHPTAVVLNETGGHKTILFPGNKGPKTITWEQTKQMAFELNEEGYDVAFLPELSEVLKLLNMDAGTFKSAIEYLLLNNLPLGDIILLNKYGKKIQLSKKRLPYLSIQEKDQRISIKKKREAFASLNLEPSDWNRYSALVVGKPMQKYNIFFITQGFSTKKLKKSVSLRVLTSWHPDGVRRG